MSREIRIGTLFSGIGAPEQALNKMGIKTKIMFACDNGEVELNKDLKKIKAEIKNLTINEANKYIKNLYSQTKKINYVKQSYMANYDIKEEDWFEDIRFFDGSFYKDEIDILVGGSPCQSFSIIGNRGGLEDTRGTLFYDFARIVKECQPKVFIFENVTGILSHDGGKTWDIIKNVFHSLKYEIYFDTLNAKDYGIPQDRKRLFVVGFKDKDIKFKFPEPIPLTTEVKDYLEDNVAARHYLGRKGFEFVTNPKYRNRARINYSIMQTQKANQQFNWNGDFVFEELDKVKNNKEIMERAYVSTWEGKVGVIRQLTYRECLRLMGFPDSFKIVVPNVPAYRQAGNSIVVNVLEHIFKEIFKVVSFN